MIKTLIKTHPLIYKLLKSVESDVKKSLKPKKPLIEMDKIIFK